MARFLYNGIAGDTFPSTGPTTALFCHGLPGGIGPLPAVTVANQLGWNVLAIQYPGTYDSEGQFGVSKTIESISNTIRALEVGEVVNASSGRLMAQLEPPTIVIGHSFGCLIASELIRSNTIGTLDIAVMLAPIISYCRAPDFGARENLLDHLEYVRRSRPLTYRLGDLDEWRHIAGGGSIVEQSKRPWAGRVLAAAGARDDTFAIDALQAAFAGVVGDYLGAAELTLEIIPEAGHAMHELLTSGVIRQMDA